MGKLWTFGDSFTYGQGCLPGDEYYEYTDLPTESTWPTIISNKLQLEEVNKGLPGNSTPYIIKQVIDNLSNFNTDDTVILSDTHSTRTILFNRRLKKIQPVAAEIVYWQDLNKNSKHFLESYFKNEEEKQVYVEYLYNFIYREEINWNTYYEKQLNSLLLHLNKLKISTYFWSHKIWTPKIKFNTIAQETNGKIKDGHWSWQGHKDFAEYLLERINKKQYEYKSPLI